MVLTGGPGAGLSALGLGSCAVFLHSGSFDDLLPQVSLWATSGGLAIGLAWSMRRYVQEEDAQRAAMLEREQRLMDVLRDIESHAREMAQQQPGFGEAARVVAMISTSRMSIEHPELLDACFNAAPACGNRSAGPRT